MKKIWFSMVAVISLLLLNDCKWTANGEDLKTLTNYDKINDRQGTHDNISDDRIKKGASQIKSKVNEMSRVKLKDVAKDEIDIGSLDAASQERKIRETVITNTSEDVEFNKRIGSQEIKEVRTFWENENLNDTIWCMVIDDYLQNHLLLATNHTVYTVDVVTQELSWVAGDPHQDKPEGEVWDGNKFGLIRDVITFPGTTHKILVADGYNFCIRLVNRRNGENSTFAGQCGFVQSDSASLNWVISMVVHPTNNSQLFVFRNSFFNSKGSVAIITIGSNGKQSGTIWEVLKIPKKEWVYTMILDPTQQYLIVTAQYHIWRIQVDVLKIELMINGSRGHMDGHFNNTKFGRIHSISFIDENIAVVVDSLNSVLRVLDFNTQQVTTICQSHVRGEAEFSSGTSSDCVLTAPTAIISNPFEKNTKLIASGANIRLLEYRNISSVVVENTITNSTSISPLVSVQSYLSLQTEIYNSATSGITGKLHSTYTFGNVEHLYADLFNTSDAPIHYLLQDEFIEDNILLVKGHAIYTLNLISQEFHLIAGNETSPGSKDGVGSEAKFNGIQGVITLPADSSVLLVSDSQNYCIRSIQRSTNESSQFAGKCGVYRRTDGLVQRSRFYQTSDLVVKVDKNSTTIYTWELSIAIKYNNVLRYINVSEPLEHSTTGTMLPTQGMVVDGVTALAFFPNTDKLCVASESSILSVDIKSMTFEITLIYKKSDDEPKSYIGVGETASLFFLDQWTLLVADAFHQNLKMLNFQSVEIFLACQSKVKHHSQRTSEVTKDFTSGFTEDSTNRSTEDVTTRSTENVTTRSTEDFATRSTEDVTTRSTEDFASGSVGECLFNDLNFILNIPSKKQILIAAGAEIYQLSYQVSQKKWQPKDAANANKKFNSPSRNTLNAFQNQPIGNPTRYASRTEPTVDPEKTSTDKNTTTNQPFVAALADAESIHEVGITLLRCFTHIMVAMLAYF